MMIHAPTSRSKSRDAAQDGHHRPSYPALSLHLSLKPMQQPSKALPPDASFVDVASKLMLVLGVLGAILRAVRVDQGEIRNVSDP